MKKKIRDLKGSKDWLREGGNRVRLTGSVYYPFTDRDKTVVCVDHEMGIKIYETDDDTDAADLEVEVELE